MQVFAGALMAQHPFPATDACARNRRTTSTPFMPYFAEEHLIDALIPYSRVIVHRGRKTGLVDIYAPLSAAEDVATYATRVAHALKARPIFAHDDDRGFHVRVRMYA